MTFFLPLFPSSYTCFFSSIIIIIIITFLIYVLFSFVIYIIYFLCPSFFLNQEKIHQKYDEKKKMHCFFFFNVNMLLLAYCLQHFILLITFFCTYLLHTYLCLITLSIYTECINSFKLNKKILFL